MNSNYTPYCKFTLRKVMEMYGCKPIGEIVCDNKEHEWICNQSVMNYTACFDAFGSDEQKLIARFCLSDKHCYHVFITADKTHIKKMH